MAGMDDAHALIVGIADYPVDPLPPVILQDAGDIHEVLIDPSYCGYPASNVRLLLDDEATKAAILSGLAELAERATSGSTVFVYVSGHGGQIVTGDSADEFLLPSDVNFFAAAPFSEKSAISGDEFSKALRAIAANKLVVVLDVCHAGGIGFLKAAGTPKLRPGIPDAYYAGLAKGRGRVILAACDEDEFSAGMEGARNSLFTEHFLAGLRGGIDSPDEFISIFELVEYVQPRVSKANNQQHPVFKFEIEENFPIALYLGGKKKTARKKRKKRAAGDHRYDVFISHSEQEPDATWVWGTLVPRLKKSGLSVAVSGRSEDPGVPLVVGHLRGVERAKRTIAVLSERYLEDYSAKLTEIASVQVGVEQGEYRFVPIKIGPIDERKLDLHVRMHSIIDFTGPREPEQLEWLAKALRRPVAAM